MTSKKNINISNCISVIKIQAVFPIIVSHEKKYKPSAITENKQYESNHARLLSINNFNSKLSFIKSYSKCFHIGHISLIFHSQRILSLSLQQNEYQKINVLLYSANHLYLRYFELLVTSTLIILVDTIAFEIKRIFSFLPHSNLCLLFKTSNVLQVCQHILPLKG